MYMDKMEMNEGGKRNSRRDITIVRQFLVSVRLGSREGSTVAEMLTKAERSGYTLLPYRALDVRIVLGVGN